MLSTEAPPPDLPCPCVISQQNSGGSNIFSIDERDSDNNQQQLEVDLFKSDLDDNNNNPLPKFSIRDYVSSARGKDIKNNWPFSQKNLQLCLKHGVTDVLPPFQPLDTVRNPSRMKCVDVKLPALSDRILSSGFWEGKEFEPTTLPSCSNINSVPLIKAPCSKPEAVSFPRSSVEKIESSAPASRKVEKSTQNSAKNCKLMVKWSKIAEPLSTEHSEPMASKVCPVCKTFSSSSNTTLNAHIDQCLSGVSTMDWTSNSKVSKHRIKPRKTRLMVDIYETALHCTLEDLDRRNGTNWALNMISSTQDLEADTKEEKKKKIDSSIDVEGNEEGAVYVDSSGAKFLSLSKCSDLPSNSNAKDDCGTRKFVVLNKESKIPLRKKRRVLVKRHKSLKHSHYGRASSSSGPSHCPEVKNVKQKKLFHEDGYEEEYTTQPVKAYDQIKSGETEMVKQWVVGSKRTGFRKISQEHEHQHPDKSVKNVIVKDSHSSRGDSYIKGTRDSNSPVFYDENPLLPSQCRKRKENLQYASHDEHIKQLYLRKRAGVSVMTSQDCHGKRNRLALLKCIKKHSRKDRPLLHKRHIDPLSGAENLGFSGSNKRNEINTSTGLNAECSFRDSRMSHHHAFSYEGKDLAYSRQPPFDHVISPGHNKKSSMRKKSFASQASAPELKDNSRHFNLKKPRLHYTSDSDDEAVVPRSAICRRDNRVEKLSVNAAQMEITSVRSSMEPARVLKIRKKEIFLNSSKEVDMASKGSEISPELDSHGVRKNIDSFMGGDVPASTSNVLDTVKEAEIQDEFVCDLISQRADGAAFLALRKSLESSFYEIAGPSNVKSVLQGYVETYNKHCPAELLLGGESEMFYTDKVAKSMTSSDTGTVGEMDVNEGQGNYFVDVDPIPIPGPPGSFLPSPGRMSSEELQGNSSLTTCRIQSSEDKHELMDVDSSDSPISSASLVSESAAGRSDSVSAKNLSELSDGIQDQSRCNISEDRVVESSKLSELASPVEGEPDLDESRADLLLTETNTHILKNSQPCCCSRKGVFLKDSFNCQGSQIVWRRSIASLAVRSQEKRTGGDQSETALNSIVMSQTPPRKVQTPGAENRTSNSQMGYAPRLVSQDSETKFPTCGDCKSTSPSTTNPVLRLMGKNLMVVNKEETLSPQMSQTHLSMARDRHPSMLSIVDNEITTVRFPNECYSIHQNLSQVPSRYDHMQPSMLAQHLDASPPNCFENTPKIRIQGSTLHPSAFLLSSKSFGGSLASSLEHHDFASGSNMTSEFGFSIGPETPITYGVEKVQTHGHQLIRSTDFSGSRNKETLVINESLKSKPGLSVRATHDGEKIEMRRSPVGISAPVVFGHDSRLVNPAFYNNQTQGYPVCNGSQAFYATNIQVPSSMGIFKANSVQWNCTREGSAILHPNSVTVSSPAASHPRSSLYFSPGFS
ncbi:uncharacterized protein [Primulina eburnea]|uniref:uncharacterized protein n=1 Tax=Primulina eburnea TaxID=1245227 RepID=UPI003C6CA493